MTYLRYLRRGQVSECACCIILCVMYILCVILWNCVGNPENCFYIDVNSITRALSMRHLSITNRNTVAKGLEYSITHASDICRLSCNSTRPPVKKRVDLSLIVLLVAKPCQNRIEQVMLRKLLPSFVIVLLHFLRRTWKHDFQLG